MIKKVLFTLAVVSATTVMAQVNWQNNPVGAVFAREGGESPAGTFRMTSNGTVVYTLIASDNVEFYQPATLFYGPDNADQTKVDAIVPDGKVPSSMNCFLVQIDGDNILFDTGLPSSRGGKTLDRLASLNVKPGDINAIFITHSHFDHIGGLLNEKGEADYPNAKLYLSQKEQAFMEQSMKDMTEALEKAYAGRIVVFAPGEILPYEMTAIDAPGHTPGHVVYQLGNLLFTGDIMHGMKLQLVDPAICANFDMDRAQATDSREKVLNYAVGNSLTVLGAHIPNNGVVF